MSKEYFVDNGPMLNAYPDSMGGRLSEAVRFLQKKELADVFQSFYILPSVFNTDLDRGFSVIDYELNKLLAGREETELWYEEVDFPIFIPWSSSGPMETATFIREWISPFS